jgi:hypothetical protein
LDAVGVREADHPIKASLTRASSAAVSRACWFAIDTEVEPTALKMIAAVPTAIKTATRSIA